MKECHHSILADQPHKHKRHPTIIAKIIKKGAMSGKIGIAPFELKIDLSLSLKDQFIG